MSDVLSNDDLNALAAEYVLGTLDYEERKGATSLQEVDHGFRGLVRIWERRLGELHLMVEPVEPDAKVWERIKLKLGDQIPTAAFALEDIPPASETPVAPEMPQDATTPEATASEPVTQAPSISPAIETPAGDSTATLMRELEEAAQLVAPQSAPSPTAIPTTPPRRLIERDAAVSHDDVQETPRPLRRWRLFAVMMSLVAIALAGLIGAWRFAPELLPPQLSANSLLHMSSEPSELPPLPPPRKPPPPPFDE
jgi:anti-sigma-K factor RskA